jgi:hypothetical protein
MYLGSRSSLSRRRQARRRPARAAAQKKMAARWIRSVFRTGQCSGCPSAARCHSPMKGTCVRLQAAALLVLGVALVGETNAAGTAAAPASAAAPSMAAESESELAAAADSADPGRILADAKSAFDFARAHLMTSHDSHHHLVEGYSCESHQLSVCQSRCSRSSMPLAVCACSHTLRTVGGAQATGSAGRT